MGHIVSFDRLVIIYQKQRQIQKAIEICEKAINHYQNKNQEYLTKFLKLKDKLLNKEANY
jgi:flagellar biosynthesis chaperone FliJ